MRRSPSNNSIELALPRCCAMRRLSNWANPLIVANGVRRSCTSRSRSPSFATSVAAPAPEKAGSSMAHLLVFVMQSGPDDITATGPQLVANRTETERHRCGQIRTSVTGQQLMVQAAARR